jgi:hypothetical protein
MDNSPAFDGAGLRRRSKSRFGCLGCLVQCAVILALGGVLVVAVVAVFSPWGFYLGGKFHWLPQWQGVGTMHAKSGKYVVYVYFYPTPSGQRIVPESAVKGQAYLCSPQHEILRMTLGGSMRRGLNLDTDGEKIGLYMHFRPVFTFSQGYDHRPRLELRGHWQNPNLVMDDHSSIQRNFEPDGTVYRGGGKERPYMGEIVPVTIQPGSYSDFQTACKGP